MRDLCLKGLAFLGDAVIKENQRQLDKWGIQDRLPSEWVMFITEELGELAKAIGEWNYRSGEAREVVSEAIQTATLSLKIAEMFQSIVEKETNR